MKGDSEADYDLRMEFKQKPDEVKAAKGVAKQELAREEKQKKEKQTQALRRTNLKTDVFSKAAAAYAQAQTAEDIGDYKNALLNYRIAKNLFKQLAEADRKYLKKAKKCKTKIKEIRQSLRLQAQNTGPMMVQTGFHKSGQDKRILALKSNLHTAEDALNQGKRDEAIAILKEVRTKLGNKANPSKEEQEVLQQLLRLAERFKPPSQDPGRMQRPY